MEFEKLTALQLGEKIKQRQVSVLDGVKTVFEQIEKQDSEVHAYLDTYKEEAYKRAEEVQKGIEDGTYTSPLAGVPWSYVKKKYKLNTTNFLFLCNC